MTPDVREIVFLVWDSIMSVCELFPYTYDAGGTPGYGKSL